MSFTDILDSEVTDFERPPLPPLGTYRFVVSSVPTFGEISSDKGEWDTIDFPVRAVEGMTGVDPDELEQFGVQNINLRVSFMFDKHDETKQKQTKFGIRNFLENTLRLEVAGKTTKQLLNEAPGAEFLGVVRYRASKNDPEVQFAEIGKTGPLV